jgi:DNA-binding NarL/FixJ family response regulator
MIRVLIADDQSLVRTGFKMILDAESDIEVVGEAGDGAAALTMARTLRPDVVLMDVRMPGVDGITATSQVTAELPGTRILILTTFDLDDYVHAGLRAGASGFLLKDVPAPDLVAAIRTVAAGDAVLSPSTTRRFDRTLRAAPPCPGRNNHGLSRRAHQPRARSIRARRPGAVQPGDRRHPVPVRRHGQDPCQPSTGQTRAARPGSRRHPRLRGRNTHSGRQLTVL